MKFFWKAVYKLVGAWQSFTARARENAYKNGMASCGKDVDIHGGTLMSGCRHMHFGDHIYIGPNCLFYSTEADLTIDDNVTFGPYNIVVTGDHRIDCVGRHINDVDRSLKKPEDDQPVHIESDVWIGARCVILKGVTVGRGSVIAAGSVVTRDTVPYGVYGGVPAKLIKMRFTEEQLAEHKRLLKERYGEDGAGEA